MESIRTLHADTTPQPAKQCADCGAASKQLQVVAGWPLCPACAEEALRVASAETQTWRDLARGTVE